LPKAADADNHLLIMAMRKYPWVWRYDGTGKRAGQFFDVGLDPETRELWNPNRYDVTDLRRAIAKFEDRTDRRYQEQQERKAKR
jgi:hypothetical protein